MLKNFLYRFLFNFYFCIDLILFLYILGNEKKRVGIKNEIIFLFFSCFFHFYKPKIREKKNNDEKKIKSKNSLYKNEKSKKNIFKKYWKKYFIIKIANILNIFFIHFFVLMSHPRKNAHFKLFSRNISN